jgi:hypothetical protein
MNDQLQGLARVTTHRTATLIGLLFLLCASSLTAQTADYFTKIYDAYLTAVKTGSYSKVSPLISADVRRQVKTLSDQTEYMAMMKQMAPVHYETEYLNLAKDGQTAEVTIIATIAVPEKVQKEQKLPPTQRAEVELKFVKEAGQWKVGPPLFMGDPDQRARPKDLIMGSRADYAEGENTEVGGPILKVEKQAAGSVFLLRVTDEEVAVFVPADKVAATFVPGSILVVHGAMNKNDKLKMWAEDAELYKEPPSD